MTGKPVLIRVCYPLFVATVMTLGVLGLIQAWAPTRAGWVVDTLWSLVIVASVSGLVLAAYRTVALAGRERD